MFVRLICFLFFNSTLLLAHAPWGQHNVYRQSHMLIMCSKEDRGAFKFTKYIASYLDNDLPSSRARVARAPHKERIIDLLKTNQIPLAIFSYDLLSEIFEKKDKSTKYLSEDARVLFFFSDMVLVSNKQFSYKKSKIVFDSLKAASNKKNNYDIKFKEKTDFFIPFYNSYGK